MRLAPASARFLTSMCVGGGSGSSVQGQKPAFRQYGNQESALLRKTSGTAPGTVFAALALICFTAGADALDIACEGCSHAQMVAAALAHGEGDHRVYSVSTDVIHGFSIRCGDGGDMARQLGADVRQPAPGGSAPCPPGQTLEAEEVALSPQMADSWQGIQQFYMEWDGLPRADQRRHGEGGTRMPEFMSRAPRSVFTYLADYSARTSLHDEILADHVALQRSAQAPDPSSGGVPDEHVFTLRFADGTRVRVSFHPGHWTLTTVPHSARLPNGEPVVETSAIDYAGSYSAAGLDLGAYGDFLRTRGVEVVSGGGPAGRIVCTWGGKTLTCQLPEDTK